MIAVYIERENGRAKKSSLEALSYAKNLAVKNSAQSIAIVAGGEVPSDLGDAGADAIVHVTDGNLNEFTPEGHATAISEVCKQKGVTTLIMAGTYAGKILAPICSVKLKAGCVTGVVSEPDLSNGFVVRKSCFSNKAFTMVNVKSDRKVLSLIPNSFEVGSFGLTPSVESISVSTSVLTKSLEVDKVKGKIPLTEAELVVSAGRGMKGPENWGMIEELADILGAATACSKPVADLDWRPHGEHVGQTGITIKPNLYIAIGISGAIQHLAGVSSSKVICVINTDPEAPFFKVADYGIVGDAFEVVPKLIERARQLKGL
ncbi:MAG: electron transfer flavoprotein subunit alpha/FixB family protein [Bacteroidetes bacterium]|nr:electron transfer flavoprotein subunit alpha/FixB family protein [Bacteroidota bacterium]